MAVLQKQDALQRLKVLIDSFTPIVVIETVEEVRAACFPWIWWLSSGGRHPPQAKRWPS